MEKTEKIIVATKGIFSLASKIANEINNFYKGLEEVEKNTFSEQKLWLANYFSPLGCAPESLITWEIQGKTLAVALARWREAKWFPSVVEGGLYVTLQFGEKRRIDIVPATDCLGEIELRRKLEKFGEDGWERAVFAMKAVLVKVARLAQGIKPFNFSAEVEAELKAVETEMRLEERDNALKSLTEEKDRLAVEASSLHQQLGSRSAELDELRRMQQTKEEIARAMAKTLAVESELALANLRLAVGKAVADLAGTKGISKSRRFAQIRKDLEAAINSPAANPCDGCTDDCKDCTLED